VVASLTLLRLHGSYTYDVDHLAMLQLFSNASHNLPNAAHLPPGLQLPLAPPFGTNFPA
jgi:hypothetical protein